MTRQDAIKILIEYKDDSIERTFREWEEFDEKMCQAIDMAIDALQAVKVAYICDGRECDSDCSECFRTLDVEHAKNFIRLGDAYMEQPSADAVEVVRCKECKHYEVFPTWSACTYWSGDPYEQASVNADDFCSYGEREGE